MGADLLAGPTLNRSLPMHHTGTWVCWWTMPSWSSRILTALPRPLPVGAGGDAKANAAVAATHEVGNRTTLATLTIVVVFLPTLVTGMLGDYFYPITFNVPVAMIASARGVYSDTMDSWALAPHWHAAPGSSVDEPCPLCTHHDLASQPMAASRLFTRRFCTGDRLSAACLAVRPARWRQIEVSFLECCAFPPKDDKDNLLGAHSLPETTPLVTTRLPARLKHLLREQPHVLNYTTHVGIPAVIDFQRHASKGAVGNIGSQYAEIRVNPSTSSPEIHRPSTWFLALRFAIENIAAPSRRHHPAGRGST